MAVSGLFMRILKCFKEYKRDALVGDLTNEGTLAFQPSVLHVEDSELWMLLSLKKTSGIVYTTVHRSNIGY